MSEAYRVDVRSVDGGPTALGWGGSATVVIDRPTEAGGRGLGFNGGQLLNLAVAGCVSNDLFREAAKRGIRLDRVRVVAESDYSGDPPSRPRSSTKSSSRAMHPTRHSPTWSPTWTRSRRSELDSEGN